MGVAPIDHVAILYTIMQMDQRVSQVPGTLIQGTIIGKAKCMPYLALIRGLYRVKNAQEVNRKKGKR